MTTRQDQQSSNDMFAACLDSRNKQLRHFELTFPVSALVRLRHKSLRQSRSGKGPFRVTESTGNTLSDKGQTPGETDFESLRKALSDQNHGFFQKMIQNDGEGHDQHNEQTEPC